MKSPTPGTSYGQCPCQNGRRCICLSRYRPVTCRGMRRPGHRSPWARIWTDPSPSAFASPGRWLFRRFSTSAGKRSESKRLGRFYDAHLFAIVGTGGHLHHPAAHPVNHVDTLPGRTRQGAREGRGLWAPVFLPSPARGPGRGGSVAVNPSAKYRFGRRSPYPRNLCIKLAYAFFWTCAQRRQLLPNPLLLGKGGSKNALC